MGGRTRKLGRCWEVYFTEWERLERSAGLIGFKEGGRGRCPEFLLRIKRLPPKERYREWIGRYVKKNKRWVERGPKPAGLLSRILGESFLGAKVKPEAAGK